MKQEEPILVAIRCTVYNHEPYLRDCLEGFVMQKTNFRFVAVVHDDCSTDNSAAIIREYEAKYPDIFRPIYETENQWHKTDGSLGRIMNAAIDATGAKYIAFCEGDDYWTDSYKLQKQVDYLENHPECSLCFHGVKIYDENTKTLNPDFLEDVPFSTSGLRLAQGNYIHTVSVMYRNIKEIFDKYNSLGKLTMGDQILYLLYAEIGNLTKLPDIMAVYRIGSGGWSRTSDAYRHIMSVVSLSKIVPLISNIEVKQQLDKTIYSYVNVVLSILEEKEQEILKLHRSKAYRLSRFLLRPFNLIK